MSPSVTVSHSEEFTISNDVLGLHAVSSQPMNFVDFDMLTGTPAGKVGKDVKIWIADPPE